MCTIPSCRQVCHAWRRRRSSPECFHRPQCKCWLPTQTITPSLACLKQWHACTQNAPTTRNHMQCLGHAERCMHHKMRSKITKACSKAPVAQSAPLYPAAHMHVHDPVVPLGVPCVASQAIVPAVFPSPAVHMLAANANHHTIPCMLALMA